MSVNISQIPNSFLFPISEYNALLRSSDKNQVLPQMRNFNKSWYWAARSNTGPASKSPVFVSILKYVSDLGKWGD